MDIEKFAKFDFKDVEVYKNIASSGIRYFCNIGDNKTYIEIARYDNNLVSAQHSLTIEDVKFNDTEYRDMMRKQEFNKVLKIELSLSTLFQRMQFKYLEQEEDSRIEKLQKLIESI